MDRSRSWSLSRSLLCLGLAAILFIPNAGPAAAQESSVTGSESSQPVAEPEVQRFLSLWMPRVADQDWFQSYVDQHSFPEEIVAEGFHDLGAAEKAYLSTRLYDSIAESSPEFAAGIQERKRSGRASEVNDEKAVLDLFIFDKSRFDSPPAGAQPKEQPSAAAAPQQPTALERKLDTLRVIHPLKVTPRVAASPVPPAKSIRPKLKTEQSHIGPPADPLSQEPRAGHSLDRERSATRAGRVSTAGSILLAPQLPATPVRSVSPERARAYNFAALTSWLASQGPRLDTHRVTPTDTISNRRSVSVSAPNAPAPSLEPVSPADALPLPVASGPQPSPAQRPAPPVKPTPATPIPAPSVIPSDSTIPLLPQDTKHSESLVPRSRADLFLPGAPNDLTFRLCAISAAAPACSVDTPFGGLALLDVDGDGSFDVSGRITPDQSATTLGLIQQILQNILGIFGSVQSALDSFGATLEIDKIDATQQIAADVYAVFDVSQAATRFGVGFDGRRSTIATKSTLDLQLASSGSALAGHLSLTANVAHEAPGASSGISVRAWRLAGTSPTDPGSAYDPIDAHLIATPVPSLLTAKLDLDRSNGQDDTAFTIQNHDDTTTAPVIEAAVDIVNQGAQHAIRGTIDALPKNVTLSLKRAASGATTASYAADAPIDHLTLSDSFTPSTNTPDDFIVVSGDLRQIPKSVAITFPSPTAASYDASDVLGSAGLDVFRYASGALAEHLGIAMAGVPIHVALDAAPPQEGISAPGLAAQAAPPTTLSYSSSGRLGSIGAHYDRGVGGKSLNVFAQSLPRWARMTLGEDAVEFDARDAETDAPGSSSIGTLRVQFSSNGSPYLASPSGENHLVATHTDTGVTKAEFRYSGLALASINTANDEVHATLQNATARPFDIDIHTPTDAITGRIEDVPAKMTVDYVANDLTYTASSIIASATLSIARPHGEGFTATALAIPATAHLKFDPTGRVLTWEASSSVESLVLEGKTLLGDQLASVKAELTSLPRWMQASFDGVKMTFDARNAANGAPESSSIGAIDLRFTSQGDYLVHAPVAEDHLWVNHSSDLTQAEFVYSALAGASIDSANDELRATITNTAPRVFSTEIQTSDATLKARIDKIPSTMTLVVIANKITYEGSAGIAEATASLRLPGEQSFAIAAAGIPESISLLLDATTKTLTWESSSTVDSITVAGKLIVAGALASIEANLTSLPVWMQASFGTETASFDARTGKDAPSGSASIGRIVLKYASSGSLLVGLTNEDHLFIVQNGQPLRLRAELAYSGLAFASLNAANDQLHGLLKNASPRLFVLNIETPAALVTGRIDSIPSSVQIDYASNRLKYTASSTIANATLTFNKLDGPASNPAAGQAMTATVTGIPAVIDLFLDATNRKITWSSSSGVESVTFSATIQANAKLAALSATLTTLPRSLRLTFAADGVTFDARTSDTDTTPGSASIGRIFGRYSSDGSNITSVPPFNDDHLWLTQTLGGVLQVELQYSGLALASLSSANDEFRGTLNSAVPRPVDITLDTPDELITGRVDSVPATMTLNYVANKVTYRGSSPIQSITLNLNKRNGPSASHLDGEAINATVTDIPAGIDLTLDATGRQVIWSASAPVGSVGILATVATAAPVTAANLTSIDATLVSLPRSMKVGFGTDTASFDARTSDSDQTPGSASIGKITLRFASAGAFMTGAPSTVDHLWVAQAGSPLVTQADFLYSGLAFASLNGASPTQGANNEFHAVLKNVAPRVVDLKISTPNVLVTGAVDSVPASVNIDFTGNRVKYTGSGEIASASITMNQLNGSSPDKLDGEAITATATGIPATIDLSLDAANRQATWTASSSVERIVVSAAISVAGTLAKFVGTLDSLPKFFTLGFGPDGLSFDARTAQGGAQSSIGRISLKFASKGEPNLAPPIDTDHLWITQAGSPVVTQADFAYSGLALASLNAASDQLHGDLKNSAPRKVDLKISTANALITGSIDKVPESLHIDYANNKLTYIASATIGSATLEFNKLNGTPVATDGELLKTTVFGIPARIDLTFDVGGSQKKILWSASSGVDSVTADAKIAVGSLFASAHIELGSLPRFMQLLFATDNASFDARTSDVDPTPGSASIGKIIAKFASSGGFIPAAQLPATDHLWVVQSGSPVVTQADFLYTGLALATLNVASDQLHAKLNNSSPRRVDLRLSTPNTLVTGVIDSVPTTMSVDYVGNRIKYTASAPIASATLRLDLLDTDAQQINATITGVPASIDLFFDMANQKIDWTSSAPAGSITGGARIKVSDRVWELTAGVTGVPARWTANMIGSHPHIEGISGPLGTLSLTVTNHNGAITRPVGNHLWARYSATDSAPLDGNFDASFRISEISLIDLVTSGTGYTANFKAGGGSKFTVDGSITIGLNKATLFGTLDPMPSSLVLDQNLDALTYASSETFDIDLEADVGWSPAFPETPAPPLPPLLSQGLSVRDGRGCAFGSFLCGNAIKTRIVIDGFPTYMRFEPTTTTRPYIEIKGFTPPVKKDSMVVNVALEHILGSPLTLLATQNDVPSPVDFSVGPLTSSSSTTAKEVKLVANASASLGAFQADLTKGTAFVQVKVSNIPHSASIGAKAVVGSASATMLLSEPIDSASIGFSNTGAKTFGAIFTLGDVPTAASLTFGVASASGGDLKLPTLAYAASASTLDITAGVSKSFFANQVDAFLSLGITDIGADTSATFDNGLLKMTSNCLAGESCAGPTNFEIHTSAKIKFKPPTASVCLPSCGAPFHVSVTGHAAIDPFLINDLKIAATAFSSIFIIPGISLGVTGNFSSFDLSWKEISFKYDIGLTMSACLTIDFPKPLDDINSCVDDLPSISKSGTETANIRFHVSGNHYADVFNFGLNVNCFFPFSGKYQFVIQLNPHRHSSADNALHLASPSTEGGWVVTMNPNSIMSDDVANVIAALTSPFPNAGVRLVPPCTSI